MLSFRSLPRLLVVLGLAGLAISAYLVETHYGKQPIACGGVGDCDFVNSSEYASLAGIPVSVLGVGMYLGLTSSAVFWSLSPLDEKRMIVYWGLALSGAGYAAYLTYVELHILHAICVYCVASATVLTLSLALATLGLFTTPVVAQDAPPPGKRRHASSPASQSSYSRRRGTE